MTITTAVIYNTGAKLLPICKVLRKWRPWDFVRVFPKIEKKPTQSWSSQDRDLFWIYSIQTYTCLCYVKNRSNISDLHVMELYDNNKKGQSVLPGGLHGTSKCCPPVDCEVCTISCELVNTSHLCSCFQSNNICPTAYWHSHPHNRKRHPWK